jgi:class 3 adenylate cyclase
MRLLNAAKKFKIVPIGFIAGQLQTERALVPRAGLAVPLPSGFVTMLMTDIEGSTALVQQLGERYAEVINDVWSTLRRCVGDAGGHEVEARADEFFAAFESPRAAVDAAISVQHDLLARSRADGLMVLVRVGIHSGYPTSTENNYIGIDVNMASRICSVGHGGQIVVSANTREAVKASVPAGIRFKTLGSHRLRGVPDSPMLYQVAAKGLPTTFPPLRTS